MLQPAADAQTRLVSVISARREQKRVMHIATDAIAHKAGTRPLTGLSSDRQLFPVHDAKKINSAAEIDPVRALAALRCEEMN